ncbi:enoyl-CoA hydratase/isomerase family protein [Xylariaceae sp. FL0804]|nr:enoyl-CoA hydratase/isomerase family protein [Xylariaceae sp. FL0804]
MATTGTKELFSIPIAAQGAESQHPGGRVAVTEPAPRVYLLTWHSPPDNRLTPAFCAAVLEALDALEFGSGGGSRKSFPPGVVVTASALPRFYSNGLDLALAVSTPGFWGGAFYGLLRRLLTFPWPTVALIGGHAFAGGLMLAMHHDYRVFVDNNNSNNNTAPAGGDGKQKASAQRPAYLCVNELEFGAPLPAALAAIFRLKVAAPVYRDLVLEARRYDARAALDAGLVDAVDGRSGGGVGGGGLDAVLALVRDRALVKRGETGVYGLLKAEMYRESVALLNEGHGAVAETRALQAAEKKRREAGLVWFGEWERRQQQQQEGGAGKAKL